MQQNHLPGALIAYLEGLTVTQGRLTGQPLRVLPWQKRFLRGAFKPGVVESGLTVARGNGKTTFTAGLACATLDGPLAGLRGETIIVASSFEQARICFEHVLSFMRERYDLSDGREWRIWDSANNARIERKSNGARVKCIGSDPARAHGLAPVLALLDEPAQWEPSTSERMLAAIMTASGKLPESRIISLGTRPADAEHWFAKMLGGGADYAQVHAASAEDGRFDRRTWAKANPSLRYMPDLLAAIVREAGKAKLDPSALASFEALRLNTGVSDVVRQVLLSAETWQRIEGDVPAEGRPVWGVDLGTSAAQSCVAAYWRASGRLECLGAFPSQPGLAERGLRDGVGRLYVECANRGELIHAGEYAVNISELMRAAMERFGPPTAVASDHWREDQLREALKAAGVPLASLELRGMGFKDGAADVRAFTRACLEDKVTPVPSLLLASAMAEARTIIDPAGNAKLCKGTEGGRRLRARDDAAAAAILAVALGNRRASESGGMRSLGLAG